MQVNINFLSCQIDNFYFTIGIIYSFMKNRRKYNRKLWRAQNILNYQLYYFIKSLYRFC